VVSNAIILRDVEGNAYRVIGSMQDISKQVGLEERLETEVKLKETQIIAAIEEAREAVRSAIGKELHDNVNQLLAVSRMYLDVAKRGGDNTESFLTRSSEYMMKAIEEIRNLTKGLTTDTIKDLGLYTAIDKLVVDTMEVNPIRISVDMKQFAEESVDDQFKINLFRIVQEQLNNILKHSAAKKAKLVIKQSKTTTKLFFSDNGIGFKTTKKRNGIGIDNIMDRARKFNGEAFFDSSPGSGSALTVSFPNA
jgi:signal transduction histidine kinase